VRVPPVHERDLRRPNGTGAPAVPGRRWDTWPACRYLYAMTSLALDGAV